MRRPETEIYASSHIPFNTAAKNDTGRYDDPQAKIWSMYMSEAARFDKALAESWKGDMDGILIFAGLFSASVTAFLVESYKNLKPDSEDAMIVLLARISQQISAPSNSSIPLIPFNQTPFTPKSSALRVNAFWSLSLMFSLLCALMATLIQQWARIYVQAVERRPSPHAQARIRAYLYDGFDTFKVAKMVESVPMLLHIALFLFFAGLVDFLFEVNSLIAYLALGIVLAAGGLYTVATLLPTFILNCPYRTPLSSVCWSALNALRMWRRSKVDQEFIHIRGSMLDGQEAAAMESPHRTRRDVEALHFTLSCLNEDSDFEPFVEAIPSFLRETDLSDGLVVMHKLLLDKKVQLGSRVHELLVRTKASGVLSEDVKLRRAFTCLHTIFYMTKDICQKSSTPWISLLSHDILREIVAYRDWSYQGTNRLKPMARCTCAVLGCSIITKIMHSLRLQAAHSVERQYGESLWALLSLRADIYLVKAAKMPDRSSFLHRRLSPLRELFTNDGTSGFDDLKWAKILFGSHIFGLIEFIDHPMFGNDIPDDNIAAICQTLGFISGMDASVVDHDTQMLLVRSVSKAMFRLSDSSSDASSKPPKAIANALFQTCFSLRDPEATEEALVMYAKYHEMTPEVFMSWKDSSLQTSSSGNPPSFEQLLGTAAIPIKSEQLAPMVHI